MNRAHFAWIALALFPLACGAPDPRTICGDIPLGSPKRQLGKLTSCSSYAGYCGLSAEGVVGPFDELSCCFGLGENPCVNDPEIGRQCASFSKWRVGEADIRSSGNEDYITSCNVVLRDDKVVAKAVVTNN